MTTIRPLTTPRPHFAEPQRRFESYLGDGQRSGQPESTFQGTGSIAGGATLVDNGTGALTILTVNSYSGGTTIGTGAQINAGNGTTAGSIGSGPVVNSGVLDFNLPTATSESIGAASGSGSLTLVAAGTGLLTLNGADTLAGNTTITSGTLIQGAAMRPQWRWRGRTVVNGTLDMGGLGGMVNGLSGTGTIDNKEGGAPTLSVTGSGTFGGVIKNSTGVLSLNMNGSGQTLTWAVWTPTAAPPLSPPAHSSRALLARSPPPASVWFPPANWIFTGLA